MRNRLGIALVLCAPSGAGKTTLSKRLLEEFPSFAFSISCTTRAPRPGEENGRDYHFLTKEAFLELRDTGHFAEWAEVHGNFYGTPLQSALETLASGRDMLFDIDVQGAAQIKKNMPHACFIFILPPSRDTLGQRLRGRGSESEESLAKRLGNAKQEIAEAVWFDALIINDDLDTAYADLCAAYRVATLSPVRQPNLVPDLLKEWQ